MKRTISLLAALLGASLALTGCADDCEVACGKLQFCELLPDVTLMECVDRCEARGEQDRLPEICADCLDQASCGVIAAQASAQPCGPVLSGQPLPDGGGGSGGSGGSGGAGGTSGSGGSGGA